MPTRLRLRSSEEFADEAVEDGVQMLGKLRPLGDGATTPTVPFVGGLSLNRLTEQRTRRG